MVCNGESSIMDIQAEILADILSRIPFKTIVHCRCVCKTWLSILSEPYFVDLHLPRSPAGLILHISNSLETDILKLGELDQDPDIYDIHYDPVMRFDLELGFEYNVLLLCDTVNGLICLWDYHAVRCYITNPITREYILLPDQNYDVTSLTIVTHGFGYVEASNEYKVVSLYMDTKIDDKSECKIYTLGTSVWRSLGHLTFSLINCHNGTYVNGNLHWLTNDHKDIPDEMVCTFDLEKELFHLTASAPLCDETKVSGRNYRDLGILGGCLCVCDNSADSEFSIWVMKDYGMKESWSKEIVIRDKPIDLRYRSVRPLIFLNSGSILMVCHDMSLFTYCPEYGTLEIIDCPPNDAFDAMVFVPSFIRLDKFLLEKVLVF